MLVSIVTSVLQRKPPSGVMMDRTQRREQHVRASSQPVRASSQPVDASSQPVRASSQPVRASSQPVDASSQPECASSQPMHASSQPERPVSEQWPHTGYTADWMQCNREPDLWTEMSLNNEEHCKGACVSKDRDSKQPIEESSHVKGELFTTSLRGIKKHIYEPTDSTENITESQHSCQAIHNTVLNDPMLILPPSATPALKKKRRPASASAASEKRTQKTDSLRSRPHSAHTVCETQVTEISRNPMEPSVYGYSSRRTICGNTTDGLSGDMPQYPYRMCEMKMRTNVEDETSREGER